MTHLSNSLRVAETVGIKRVRLEDAADVEPGIQAALSHDGPVPTDAVVNRQELAVPSSVTVEMANHLYRTHIRLLDQTFRAREKLGHVRG